MSSLFFCCLLVTVFPAPVLGQTAYRRNKEKEALRMLCQRWYTTYKVDSLQCFPTSFFYSIDILPDGSISFSAPRPVTGMWNFDAIRNNLFVLVNNSIWKYKVLLLSRDELVLESTVNRKSVKHYLRRAGAQVQ